MCCQGAHVLRLLQPRQGAGLAGLSDLSPALSPRGSKHTVGLGFLRITEQEAQHSISSKSTKMPRGKRRGGV